ncbi:dTDP-4-dehydrorhamnose reductase [Candidatus Scalindua japonica]|uniref:dTDP-4-dehydrorhamnose reductase n=1 Tax=Candidatus Scalindua japonica TaxID=1284222 RepID=A0A286U471_9BACT|nr:NAD(P)-dependent oxidoreductase [Candidatus Scalindua japonica]GAX62925.1 dTDP-4-dehydrorhamnose reductase [Candidatus Scalindua japonica]
MHKRKILITGGRGMLATDLAAFFLDKPFDVRSVDRHELDITCRDQVQAFFQSPERPDVVINTPCLHVEPCEDVPQTAYAINAWGPKLLAETCQHFGATLIQISTCGIFGDTICAYHEYDPVVLKTSYARSKYAGEKYVSRICDKHYILRLGWLYGGEVHHARNFIVARYREALQTDVMHSAGDKYGSPTYTFDVGETLLSLLDADQYGVYHVSNQGGCSRAEYVREILHAFGLDVPVEEVDSSHFPRKANVPDCEILTSYNLSYVGVPLLEPWKEALARYVHLIKNKIL